MSEVQGDMLFVQKPQSIVMIIVGSASATHGRTPARISRTDSSHIARLPAPATINSTVIAKSSPFFAVVATPSNHVPLPPPRKDIFLLGLRASRRASPSGFMRLKNSPKMPPGELHVAARQNFSPAPCCGHGI
jgi:hypothetical protein